MTLEKIVPEHGVLEAYEVDHEFPTMGRRIMLVNAREISIEGRTDRMLLLAIEDVTDRRSRELEIQHLLHQKELLLEEMEHRIANSLQIIASILLLKASTVQSEETLLHLQDAHKRVMSVAAVQQHLHLSRRGEQIAMAPYLTTLCQTLEQSMIGDSRPAPLTAAVSNGSLVSSEAVSVGLIVTECVINALKHAFPREEKDGHIVVAFEANGSDWMLSISDNGQGKPTDGAVVAKSGLGTSIVNALAQQLAARVEILSGQSGTMVSVSHTAICH